MKPKFKLLLFFVAVLSLSANIPNVYAQWVPTGPEGGYVKCMTQSGNNIYAVSGFYWLTTPEFYNSSDNGSTWDRINSVSLPSDIRDIVSLGNSLFLGTGSGIYRSDDGGLTWVEKNNGFPAGDKWINHLAVGSNTIFAAGTSSGMLRSLDNGEHWTVVNSGLTDTYIYSLTANDEAIFAGTGDQNLGVFRSTNNGNTWQQVTNGMAYYYNGQWIYSQAPMITALGFVGTDLYAGTSEFQGIWKSTDNGDNWVFASMETMNYSEISAISGSGTTVLAGTTDGHGVIRSLNNGSTWSEANNGIDNYGQVSTFHNKGGFTFVGTKGGIYKTIDNGINWTASNSGINSQNITSPGFATIGSEIFVGTERGGVFKSQDGGNSWIASNNGLPINVWNLGNLYSTSTALFAWDRVTVDGGNTWEMANNYSPGTAGPDYYAPRWIEHGNAWFAKNNAGVYRSTDDGQNWVLLTNGLPNPNTTLFVQVSSDGTNVFLSTESGVYYSSDNGDSWNLSTFTPAVGFGMNTSAGAVFNAGNSTLIMTPGGLYNSTDHGITWEMLHYWAPPVTDYLVYYKKFFKSGNILYSQGEYSYWDDQSGRVYVNNFYMSEDEGVTWVNITEGFPAIYFITFAYEGPNIYIVGKSNNGWHIYRSADKGTTWVNVSQSFSDAMVTQLFIYGNQIFAGTNGSSVWKRNLDEFAAPVQPTAISGTETPCSGSTEIYSVENVVGVTYDWQFPQDWIVTSGSGTNSVTVTVGTVSGIALVIPSNEFGNGPSQFKLVNPSIAAEVSVSITEDQNNICEGSAMTFTAFALNGGSKPAYSWFVNDKPSGDNSTDFTYLPENGDIVKLLFTSSSECVIQNQVESNAITTVVNSIPEVEWLSFEPDSLCINWAPVLLSGGAPGGGTYTGDGITNNTFDPKAAGPGLHTITYEYTNGSGCSGQTAKDLIVNVCAGITDLNSNLMIYPNPVNDLLTIEMKNNQAIETIELYNAKGIKVIEKRDFTGSAVIIPTTGLPAGIYILKVNGRSETLIRSIILN
ncbi:MAG: T9SS type A sorting domain-containing protein [Bacteroidota bacterium]